MHRLMLFVLFLGWFSVSGVAQAHDMWIEPTTFTPPSNALVSVKLRIGDTPSTAKPVRRSQDQILRFLIHDGDKEKPVIGRDGADPAGLLRPPSSGLQVIGYQSTPAFIELQADTFASYLAEKGLEHIRDFRTQRGGNT